MSYRPLSPILNGTILLMVRSPHQLAQLVECFSAWHSRVHVCPPCAYSEVLSFTLSCLPDLAIISADWSPLGIADISDIADGDVNAPGLDPDDDPECDSGYELCRRFRRDPRLESLPTVILESPEMPLERDRIFASGA
ncbi:MAG: hypothetical protein AAGF75_13150, partial [Cyanobacteria bacterium P01_H01_bin.130]